MSLKRIKFKFRGTILGMFAERCPLRLQMWREKVDPVRRTKTVNMRTELEEPTREDKEKFTGEGRMKSPTSKGKKGNPEVRNPDKWSPGWEATWKSKVHTPEVGGVGL